MQAEKRKKKKSYALFTHVAGPRMHVNQWERKEEA